MAEWPTVRVVDVTSLVTKGTTPTTDGGRFADSGIAFVKVESIRVDGTIDRSKLAFIDVETHDRLRRSQLAPDDVLFTIAGTIGRVARVPGELVPANTNQAVAIVRPNTALVDPGYLTHCLRDRRRLRQALGRVVQSVQANLSLAELSSLEIPLPPLSVQRAISRTLQTFDDKIAVNERTVRLADELSLVLFRAACTDEVPLSSLARFVNGRAFTKNATGTGRIVIRIAELNSGLGASTVFNDIDVPDDHLARPGDLLFAWSGSLTAARWYRPEAIVNQHIFKVVPNDGVPMWLVNQAVRAKLDEFKAIAADKATTMGHIQRHHLDQPVQTPSAEATRRLDALMTGLWARALAAEVESLRLTETRDQLLPLLMSGKARVRDAEKVVEGVA